MVDTIKCQSDLDLTEAFFEKLLLGAIDKRLDHKKIHPNSAKDDQDTLALPHRSKTTGKGKERQSSDDATLVAYSSRRNSLHANRASTMRTLYESPIDDAPTKPNFGGRPPNMTTPRHASPPSAEYEPPSRHATFHNTTQEEEEPEPRSTQRSSTFGSTSSHWWRRNGS